MADLAAIAALAADPQLAFTGRETDVGQVEADDFGDAHPGEVGQQGQRLVARAGDRGPNAGDSEAGAPLRLGDR
ncbi:hypothetical protein [Nonomuraea helvata]|uniref:Uncharacterized protein n=1 Tax=Nonomuraea helvata TaxID=37484 RepID=A0ABV5S3G3_9ACTN